MPQAVSVRTSSAGSSTSRAIAKACSSLSRAVGAAHPEGEHGPVGQRPRPHRGRHPGVLLVEVGEGGIGPGQPFPEASPP